MGKDIYTPAFPTQEMNSDIGTHPLTPGMTLRDYFAGQAVAGLTTSQDSEGTWMYGTAQNVASKAYEIADAMMEERNK